MGPVKDISPDNKRFMKRFAGFLYKNRTAVLVICWVIAIGMGLFLPKMEIEPEVEALVPEEMDSRLNTDTIENIFGGSDNIVLLFEAESILNKSTLERIKSIDKGLGKIPEIENTISLFNSKSIKGEMGMMVVDPAIQRIPETEAGREDLRNDLISNDMVYNVIVSPDFRYTAIIGTLQKETNNDTVLTAVDRVLMENPGDEKVYLGGMPVISQAISGDITRDLRFLLPIALGLMIAILWLSFRSFNGVFLPFSIVVMSILVSMGLMPILGWKLAIVSVLLPVMLIAIANNYGIHIYNRFLEQEGRKDNPLPGPERISGLWKALARPVILTGLTTIAGILGLLSHIIIPARQVGVLASAGILWALIMSLIYIPAYLSGIEANGRNSGFKDGLMEKILNRSANIITRNPGYILLGAAILVVFMATGIFRLQVEGNIVNFFKKDHIVRESSNLIDEHMGGSQTISIHYSGDIKEPEVLSKMLEVENELKSTKGVGQVMSIAGVVKTMSRSILDPSDQYYDAIPGSRNAVAQYFELYSFSGDPADFEQLVDFNYENAQMIIRVNDPSSSTVLEVVDKINKLTKDDPNVKNIGGIGLITADMTNQLIRGQSRSLVFALAVVCLLIILIFRSWKAGALSLVPLLFACIVLFGSMGWLGIRLDSATALLSSIMIGVGVDYTIHYLWRHQQEAAKGETVKNAVFKTLTTTGRGITFNALSVMIGFAALLFSSFNPIRFFGFLTSISILTCLLGALVIIPCLIILRSPEFLGHRKSNKKIKDKRHENKYPGHSAPAFSGAAGGSK